MNMHHAESIRIKPTNSLAKLKSFFSIRLNNRIVLKLFIFLLFFIGIGLAGSHAFQKLCHSDFFQITAIDIDGCRMTDKEQIVSLSSVDIHSNLLAMNVAQVKAKLENHPWVAQAAITREWPNRLIITIKEKKPVAILNQNDGLLYLDRTGSVIARAESQQELDFPVITGLAGLSVNKRRDGLPRRPLQDVFSLLKLAGKGNSILPSQNISEIHINDEGGIILYLLDRPFPIHFGNEGKISTRYYRLVKVLRDLYKSREFSGIAYIRMDYLKDAILVGKTASKRTHRG